MEFAPAASDLVRDLSITGGWTDASCAVRSASSYSTLDAELSGAVLHIDLPQNSMVELGVRQLRLVRGRSPPTCPLRRIRSI